MEPRVRLRAHYEIVYRDKHVIAIVDKNEVKSITNDAEWVIRDLYENHWLQDTDRVLYRDTYGMWDELSHMGGVFDGFTLHQASCLSKALSRVLVDV